MLRVAVIYCLVLTTAAGPWLCCCAPGRVTALCDLAAAFLGVKGGEHRACCGCTGGSSEKLPSGREKCPTAPCECPCRVVSPALPVVAVKPVQIPAQDGEFHFALADSSTFGDDFFARTSELRDRSPRLRHPRDILALLQTLRC